MKLMKPVLWTVFGVILGAAAVLSTGHVQAQSPSTSQAEPRMVVTRVTGPRWVNLYVVHDPQSNGCWIASQDAASAAFSAMAVAPPSACATQ